MGTFKDSLKKWFFQQGSKTPTSSTLIPTIDGASGTNQGFPNGYTTMDNLASVLGGLVQRGSATSLGDFNAVTLQGLYTCTPTNMAHKPDGLSGSEGYLAHLIYSGTQIIQYLIEGSGLTNFQHVFYRKRVGEAWSDWQCINANVPDFYKNYANLSSLASALGGITSQLPNNSNVLSLDNPRIFWTIGGSTYSYENTPWTNGGSENYAIFIRLGDDSHSVLFTMSANANKVFYNLKYDATWKGWKSVNLTSQ